MSLEEAIKNTRMKGLLSQEDFAKKLNTSIGSINRWENGKTKPNLIAMKAIKVFCRQKAFIREAQPLFKSRKHTLFRENYWQIHQDMI